MKQECSDIGNMDMTLILYRREVSDNYHSGILPGRSPKLGEKK